MVGHAFPSHSKTKMVGHTLPNRDTHGSFNTFTLSTKPKVQILYCAKCEHGFDITLKVYYSWLFGNVLI